jgi:hypothetical protein
MKVALRIIDRKQRVTVGIIAAVHLTLVDEEPFNNADEDAGPAALLAINALRAVLPPIPVAVRSKIRLDEASIVNVIRQNVLTLTSAVKIMMLSAPYHYQLPTIEDYGQ